MARFEPLFFSIEELHDAYLLLRTILRLSFRCRHHQRRAYISEFRNYLNFVYNHCTCLGLSNQVYACLCFFCVLNLTRGYFYLKVFFKGLFEKIHVEASNGIRRIDLNQSYVLTLELVYDSHQKMGIEEATIEV